MIRTSLTFLALMMICFGSTFGQAVGLGQSSLNNVSIPPSPEAASLGKYGEVPVSPYTGTAQIEIPITTVQGRELAVPVSLSYQTGGIRVAEYASSVGLGWSLQAGGVITRTVRGKPDESGLGYQNVAGGLPLAQQSGAHIASLNYALQDLENLKKVADGTWDGEPDLFFFNFPGGSGRIVFDEQGNAYPIPYQKLDINVNWNTKKWEITTADGTKYVFGGDGATETTVSTSQCNGNETIQNFPSSWFLTDIYSPNGDHISFEYLAQGMIVTDIPRTETIYSGILNDPAITAQELASVVSKLKAYRQNFKRFQMQLQSAPACQGKAPDVCDGTQSISSILLKKISSPLGFVEFQYSTQDRQDLLGGKSLEDILIYDQNYNHTKTFSLSHTYWSNRLLLDEVQEKSHSNTTLPPFQLSYDKSRALPGRTSFKVDHWGYSNGKNNSSLVPEVRVQGCVEFGTADRTSNFVFGKSGALTAIQYPTGGISNITYEPHKYLVGTNTSEPLLQSISANSYCNGFPCGSGACTNCIQYDTTFFTIDSAQCVTLEMEVYNYTSSPGECDAYVYVYDLAGNKIFDFQGQAHSDNTGTISPFSSADIELAPGSYFLKTEANFRGDFAEVNLDYYINPAGSALNRDIGGIRIQKITTSDGIDPANDLVMEYVYEALGSPGLSSGELVTHPKYSWVYGEQSETNLGGGAVLYEDCYYYASQSSSVTPLGSTQGSHIGYKEVQILEGVGGSNGKTVKTFTSPSDYPEGLHEFPFGQVTSQSHLHGLPLTTKIFDASGKLKTEQINTYLQRTENFKEITGYKVGYALNANSYTSDPVHSKLIYRTYEIISEWYHPATNTSRLYADNGIDYQETVQEFEYNNPNHIQLTGTKITLSNGDQVKVNTTYPEDYANGSGDDMTDALTKLKDEQFVHALPVEQVQSLKQAGGSTWEVTAAALTKFKEFSGGVIAPSGLWVLETDQPLSNFTISSVSGGTFSQDSRYTQREEVEVVSEYGKILQMRQKDGTRIAFDWGYNQALPEAQTINGEVTYQLSYSNEIETMTCNDPAASSSAAIYCGPNTATADGWWEEKTIATDNGNSTWNVTTFYHREVAVTQCVSNNPQIPAGSNWQLLSDDCAAANEATYVRDPENVLYGSQVVGGSSSYLGFEAFSEALGNPDEDFWEFKSANEHSTDAHTGEYSRKVLPSNSGASGFGPTREFLPSDQENIYIFSAWVKTDPGFSTGKLIIHSKDNTDANNTVYPATSVANSYIDINFSDTQGEWEYVEARIDLGTIRSQGSVPSGNSLRLRVYLQNTDNSKSFYVDDIRFHSRDAQMSSYTYDIPAGVTSMAGPNGLPAYYVYDEFNRLKLGKDHKGNIIARNLYNYGDATTHPSTGLSTASQGYNYLSTEMAQQAVQTESQLDGLSIGPKWHTFKYFDGLGRDLQEVGKQASSGSNDVVSFIDYDQYGRMSKEYLPFTKSANGGNYVTSTLSDQGIFYQNTTRLRENLFPFAETVFDESPLNRPKQSSAPGQPWQLSNGRTPYFGIVTNDQTAHPIRLWTVSSGNATSSSLYADDELVGEWIQDEDYGQVFAFKDKQGREVYKKVKVKDPNLGGPKQQGGTATWAETYYVYNDLGQLAFVIPPKAVFSMGQTANFNVNALSADLCFRYVYDERGRVVEKKVPGADWEYMVYDNLDRLIMSQSGTQRLNNQWSFIKYDILGRPTESGLMSNASTTSRVAMQQNVDNGLSTGSNPNFERRASTSEGYTRNAYPRSADATGTYEVHTVTYYDDYDYDRDGTVDESWTADPQSEYTNTTFDRVHGQQTGSKVRILNTTAISSAITWLESSTFYDDYARPIHTKNLNHFNTLDYTWTDYDFIGKVEKSKLIHQSGQTDEVMVRKRFDYDHAGRVVKSWQRNNSDPEILMEDYLYNEIGEMVEKNLHSTDNGQTFLQSIDYGYNQRGWLTNINNCMLEDEQYIVQKEWLLQDMTAEVKKRSNTFEENVLYLGMTMVVTENVEGEPGEIPTRTLYQEIELSRESEADTLAYQALEEIVDDPMVMEVGGESLEEGAPNERTQEIVEGLLTLNMQTRGVENDNAFVLATNVSNAFIAQQAQTGWVNDDSDDLFGMELKYDKGDPLLNGDPLYSGNISAVCWKSASDNKMRAYGYRYDLMKRLTKAQYGVKDFTTQSKIVDAGHYDVPEIQYDLNGNITLLKRFGWTVGNTYLQIDDLAYGYDGNKLLAVTDAASVSSTNDFQDNGATSNLDYTYDANGNLLTDANKGLTTTWNHLNLPDKIDFGSGSEIHFLYDAAGNKLRKLTKATGQSDKSTDYLAGFIYKDNALELGFTESGRFVPDATITDDFRFEYYYQDHLGNTRLGFSDLDEDGSIDQSSEIIQEAHYYPYGMQMVGLNTPQVGPEHRFLLNGIEIQEDFGLNWYSTFYRQYDFQLGRWTGVDPKIPDSEGGYNGYANNPVLFADQGGDTIIFGAGVSQEFIDAFYQALNYSMVNERTSLLIHRLHTSEESFYIFDISSPENFPNALKETLNQVGIDPFEDGPFFLPGTNGHHLIVWSPSIGVLTEGLGRTSPALALLHELGHAEGRLMLGADKFDEGCRTGIPIYDNCEEFRCITEIENPVADKYISEASRKTHHGDKITGLSLIPNPNWKNETNRSPKLQKSIDNLIQAWKGTAYWERIQPNGNIIVTKVNQ